MRDRALLRILAVILVVAPIVAAPAAADIDFGIRGGVYDDANAGFVGAELLTGVTGRWFFNPNVEYVFVDNGSLWTLNADAHYDFPSRNGLALWAGGGPAVIFREVDPPRGCPRCQGVDETDIGLNLLGGVGLVRGGVRPYLQGKLVLADDNEAVLAVGLRFD